MTKQVSFDVSEEDAMVIHEIAERAAQEFNFDLMDIEMDITACHANGNPLNLQKLKGADGFNFGHDIMGIRRHINRDTGKLMNLFSPRCSAR